MAVSLFICTLAACGRGGGDYVDGVIVFDNAKNYPELDLKLSDVADVTYIPLKGVEEGYLVTPFNWFGNNAYIDDDEIYFKSRNSETIYVFDMSGNPVRQLDRRGRGPGEYGVLIYNFWMEPERNSVCVIGTDYMLKEYDATSFEFKVNGHQFEFADGPTDMLSLNSEYSIEHDRRVGRSDTDPATFFLRSKTDRKSQPLPPLMERSYSMDESYLLTYPGLTYGRGGVFMNNTRCDTIWWIDRQTLEVRPRMVDKSSYSGKKNIMVLPSFETDKYVFFSLIYQMADWNDELGRVPTNLPWPDDAMFAFYKDKERIFRIRLNDFHIPSNNDYYSIEHKFAWAYDECWLTCWLTTLNDNYGVEMYQAHELIDNMAALPPDIRKIAETLKEDDNPVLALIKFK